jgi:hypothetical protein
MDELAETGKEAYELSETMLGEKVGANPYHEHSQYCGYGTTCDRCNWNNWEATRMPSFGSRARINGLKERHGRPLLSVEDYRQARLLYYKNYPTARAQADEREAEV